MIDSPLLTAALQDQQSLARTGPTHGEVLVCNPFNGEALARLPRMGAEHARAAVAMAERGLDEPRTVDQRRRLLQSVGDLLGEHRQELARMITLENGKPISEARAEVDYAAGFFHFYAEQVHRLRPRRLRQHPREHSWAVHYRPAGVAGLIVPWNFPLAMLAKKLSATLAAGAPCVIKPAERTPLATLALDSLLRRTEMPESWVRVVVGDAREIGRVLCEHPSVRCISFTGSTEVGRTLARQSADHVKRLTLELGGNAPLIVFADADLAQCVESLVGNKFRCAGQTCVCVNRVYVHTSVAGALTELLAERVAALRLGDGLREDVDLGPLIDRSGFDKVAAHVQDALDQGARAVCGGVPEIPKDQTHGLFFPPTVLDQVPPAARCIREETFGPVIPLVTFDEEDEVIAAANSTEFGLAAYLFTRDTERARRVARALRFGHVGHNSATGPTPEAPFGGMKQSGYGREGGREGLMEFVEPQVIARPDSP